MESCSGRRPPWRGVAIVAAAGLLHTALPASPVGAGSPTTVTINQAAGQADPTSSAPIVFEVVFTRLVTLFDSSDISLAGSTAGGTLTAAVTGSGMAYTVSVTGMTTTGVVVATVPAGAADDENGRSTPASTSTDNTVTWVQPPGPSVAINQASGQPDPTSIAPITFDVAFSESVTGFDSSDVNLAASTAGGALVANVTGSGADYTMAVTGMTTSGNVVATLGAGAAQNASAVGSLASTSTDNTVAWVQPPAPSVTVNQATGQGDPASSSPIVFDVVFSETVIGFDNSDVDLTASTVGSTLTATVTGSGDTYRVSVEVGAGASAFGWRRIAAPSSGVIVVSLAAGAATGVGTGLPSLASTSTDNTVTWTGGSSPSTTNSSSTTSPPAGPTTTALSPTTTVAGAGPGGASTTVAGPTTTVGGPTATSPAALPTTGLAERGIATTVAVAAIACGSALIALSRRRT